MDASELTKRYLENKDRIGALETENQSVRDSLMQLLPYNEQEKLHTFETGKVEWVKGRTAAKVDEKKLKLALMKAGVELAVIEQAFEAATNVSVGQPTIRVTAL